MDRLCSYFCSRYCSTKFDWHRGETKKKISSGQSMSRSASESHTVLGPANISIRKHQGISRRSRIREISLNTTDRSNLAMGAFPHCCAAQPRGDCFNFYARLRSLISQAAHLYLSRGHGSGSAIGASSPVHRATSPMP